MSRINLQRFQELAAGEPDGLPGLIRFYLTTTTKQLADLLAGVGVPAVARVCAHRPRIGGGKPHGGQLRIF